VLAVQRKAQESIISVRGKHVILDRDLAVFYGVETRVLTQQVRRNPGRFPEDFAFQLTPAEFAHLKSQDVTSSWGGTRKPPWVFTEYGALQAAGVLRSGRAESVSVAISRAFVAMRDRLTDLAELARALPELRERLEALEGDVVMLAEGAADQHAETKMLTDGVKSLKDIVKEMKRAERSLPPAM
jgi:hypothetical protein